MSVRFTHPLAWGPVSVIQEDRLYRTEFSTFEDYCKEKWNIKERRAYQLMDSAKVAERLKSCTMVQPPLNERQARPLTKLPPEQQREAWQKVNDKAKEENRPVTAKDYDTAVFQWETPLTTPLLGVKRVRSHH